MRLFNSAAKGSNSPDHKPQRTPWPSQGADGEGQRLNQDQEPHPIDSFLVQRMDFMKKREQP